MALLNFKYKDYCKLKTKANLKISSNQSFSSYLLLIDQTGSEVRREILNSSWLRLNTIKKGKVTPINKIRYVL